MEPESALIFVLVSAAFLVFAFFSRNKKNLPPGPLRLPIVGNSKLVTQRAIKFGGLHHAFSEISREYSTDVLLLRLGGENMVIVQDEKLMEYICSKEEFQGRPDSFFIRLRSMGTRKGITMTDGPLWTEQRAFAIRHMHNLGLGKSKMEFLIQEEIQDLFSTLKDGGSSLRLRKYLSTCVLNVLWGMVTGARFKDPVALENLIAFMEKRATAFDMAGGLLSQFPWIRFIAPERSNFNLINRLNKSFKDLITETIEEHKETYNKDATRDFIDAFLHEMNKNDPDSYFTEDQLVMVCLDFFIGGAQTTSSTLDFALLCILRHPEVQRKAQEELDRILSPNQLPSMADKARLPYIDAIISETQRFCSVAPLVGPRRVLHDTKLAGFDIPKGYTLFMNLVPMTRDPKKWVDPNSYNPDRFREQKGRENFERIGYSFGRGKRRCPGESLARVFMFIFLASFLHRFKLEPVGKEPPALIPVPGITLSPKPYDIKISLRH